MIRVLLVDDQSLVRAGFRALLDAEAGIEVIGEAADGEEAVRMASALTPDVILMDLSLPIIDGWEATRRLKAHQDLKAIPVIALTAHAMRGDEEKARASGCDDFLTKPIDEDLLLETLNRFLGTNATS